MRPAVALAAVGLAGAAIAAVVRPGSAVLAFEVLVLYLGALLLALLAARADAGRPRAGRSAIAQALAAPRPAGTRVAELQKIERVTALGVAHAGDLHVRLRPVLVSIAAPLLAARGVDLRRDLSRARELLGDDAWDLVRPGVPRPDDAFAPGVPAERLRAAIEALEKMAP